MRNLIQTHFDHGFLAGLDLPTEKKKKERKIHKSPPLKKKKKGNNNPESVCKGAQSRHSLGGRDERGLSPPQTPGREGDALSLSPLFSEI